MGGGTEEERERGGKVKGREEGREGGEGGERERGKEEKKRGGSYLAQAGFKLAMADNDDLELLFSLSPKFWNYKYVSLHLLYVVLGMKPRAFAC